MGKDFFGTASFFMTAAQLTIMLVDMIRWKRGSSSNVSRRFSEKKRKARGKYKRKH